MSTVVPGGSAALAFDRPIAFGAKFDGTLQRIEARQSIFRSLSATFRHYLRRRLRGAETIDCAHRPFAARTHPPSSAHREPTTGATTLSKSHRRRRSCPWRWHSALERDIPTKALHNIPRRAKVGSCLRLGRQRMSERLRISWTNQWVARLVCCIAHPTSAPLDLSARCNGITRVSKCELPPQTSA
jgi:hypothetical protein